MEASRWDGLGRRWAAEWSGEMLIGGSNTADVELLHAVTSMSDDDVDSDKYLAVHTHLATLYLVAASRQALREGSIDVCAMAGFRAEELGARLALSALIGGSSRSGGQHVAA